MKKLFYGLGAIATTVAPIVAVVSCGKTSIPTFKAPEGDKPTADQIASLVKFLNDNKGRVVELEQGGQKIQFTVADQEYTEANVMQVLNSNHQ